MPQGPAELAEAPEPLPDGPRWLAGGAIGPRLSSPVGPRSRGRPPDSKGQTIWSFASRLA